MDVTQLINNYIAASYAKAWDVTILAYGSLWVCHIANMDVATMLAITVPDVKRGRVKLRGRGKDGQANANAMFEILKHYGPIDYICSRKEFLAICDWAKNTHSRNRGETAEQLLRDFYGLEMYWHKDSTPGTVAGDMIVDDIHIQHKHQNATFAS